MHGMINRAIERFVRDTYGRDTWASVTQMAGLDFTELESMLLYDTALTDMVLDALARTLDKARPEVLEDIGTYLVSHPNVEAIRRLMRFGGVSFPKFLHSLDDLPERARLAVSDLWFPDLELREHRRNFFSLTVRSQGFGVPGFGHVVMGFLRAMADDYGALVMLEHKGGGADTEILEIHLLEVAYGEGRAFELAAQAMR